MIGFKGNGVLCSSILMHISGLLGLRLYLISVVLLLVVDNLVVALITTMAFQNLPSKSGIFGYLIVDQLKYIGTSQVSYYCK